MGGQNRMKERNSETNYLRICKESGCTIANYNINDFGEESFIIPDSRDEKSGKFKISQRIHRYTNKTNDKEKFK